MSIPDNLRRMAAERVSAEEAEAKGRREVYITRESEQRGRESGAKERRGVPEGATGRRQETLKLNDATMKSKSEILRVLDSSHCPVTTMLRLRSHRPRRST